MPVLCVYVYQGFALIKCK